MPDLPPGIVYAVLRCAERSESSGHAHVVPEDLLEALCGRRPWKTGMYFQELFYNPRTICGVCEEKLDERLK